MWLNALDATTHHVYFGTSKTKVANATPKSAELQETMTNNGNQRYLSPKMRLKPRKTYYWRVDAVINKPTVYKGDVWSFKTK